TKDLKRASNDVEKITRDKEELLHDLAELRVHENEEVPSVIKKAIEKSIRAVQKKLKEINDQLPEVDLSADQKKIHKIITEWKENKKILNNARRALARGEHKLAFDPADRKAMGDTNRAEATIYDANQKLDKLAQEATLIEENNIKDPTTEEFVNIHTGNESIEKQEQETTDVAPQERAISLPPTPTQAPEPTVSVEPQGNESILYTREQALADQKEWEHKHRSSIEKIITSALEEVTHNDISQEGAVIQTPEPIKTETAEAPIENPSIPETPLLLDDGNDTPQKNSAEEQKEEIVVPIVLEEITNEDVPMKETPEDEVSTPAETINLKETRETPIQSVQLSPYVEKMLNDHLDKLFGDKGFLGFGKTKGIDSRHWNEPVNGFSTKTINEIRNPRNESGSTSTELWGVANEQERTKMHEYILQATNQTGVTPNPDEKIIDYIKRVLEITAHNNNGQQ
ncbi:MAG: hypothetical protein UW78_C0004G0001, partial [Candidatus Azambacteria bacterium GW2011_GWA1_44_9]